MGTRSLTVFQEDDGQEIVVMYRQFDGYPSGHGEELATFLKSKRVGNGIVVGKDNADFANGMADLTAQTILHFKQASPVGGIYLHRAGTRDLNEEFIYTVYLKAGKIHLRVEAGAMSAPWLATTPQYQMQQVFDGPVSKFKAEKCEEVA